MKGTEKQIKWAEEIKSKLETGFKNFTPNPMMEKATNYILNIDNATFWIDEARFYVDNPIGLVMAFASPNGILTNGTTGADVAFMDKTTGEIKETKRTV